MSLEHPENVVYSGCSNEGTRCQVSELTGFGATFVVQSQTRTGLTSGGAGARLRVAMAAAGSTGRGSWVGGPGPGAGGQGRVHTFPRQPLYATVRKFFSCPHIVPLSLSAAPPPTLHTGTQASGLQKTPASQQQRPPLPPLQARPEPSLWTQLTLGGRLCSRSALCRGNGGRESVREQPDPADDHTADG